MDVSLLCRLILVIHDVLSMLRTILLRFTNPVVISFRICVCKFTTAFQVNGMPFRRAELPHVPGYKTLCQIRTFSSKWSNVENMVLAV